LKKKWFICNQCGKEYGYIDVTKDKMVTITTFGLQQLK